MQIFSFHRLTGYRENKNDYNLNWDSDIWQCHGNQLIVGVAWQVKVNMYISSGRSRGISLNFVLLNNYFPLHSILLTCQYQHSEKFVWWLILNSQILLKRFLWFWNMPQPLSGKWLPWCCRSLLPTLVQVFVLISIKSVSYNYESLHHAIQSRKFKYAMHAPLCNTLDRIGSLTITCP